ncbi:hypothetical protein F5882DRAFT_446331 [Hyaloscypha sp. PMI_1271]|nr:hypothetical protein F5882DRAFT_446331 [Hyaloscypha sp. PMI_1271]
MAAMGQFRLSGFRGFRGEAAPPELDDFAWHGSYLDDKNTPTWESLIIKMGHYGERLLDKSRVLEYELPVANTLPGRPYGIIQDAHFFLEGLAKWRLRKSGDNPPNHPIVFVGHSLGGIFVKLVVIEAELIHNATNDLAAVYGPYNYQAIRDANIRESIAGLIVLGTPHQESPGFSCTDVLKAAADGLWGHNKRDVRLMRYLEGSSHLWRELTETFKTVSRWQIHSYFETKGSGNDDSKAVELASVIIGVENETILRMPETHKEILSFNAWYQLARSVDAILKGKTTTRLASLRRSRHKVTGL